jgi:uncharacterized protein YjdB
VAQVDNNGVVTGKKSGYAVITVTPQDGGFTASCGVVVLGFNPFPFNPFNAYDIFHLFR